jgi:hypothetical protein
MHARTHVSNPFVMLIDPESLLKAIDASDRLKTLRGRVCRPLDKPMLARTANEDVARFDAEIDSAGVDADLE